MIFVKLRATFFLCFLTGETEAGLGKEMCPSLLNGKARLWLWT